MDDSRGAESAKLLWAKRFVEQPPVFFLDGSLSEHLAILSDSRTSDTPKDIRVVGADVVYHTSPHHISNRLDLVLLAEV